MIPAWRKCLYGNIISLIKRKVDQTFKVYKAPSGTVYMKSKDIEIRISSHLRTKESNKKYSFDILTKNRRKQFTWDKIRSQIDEIVKSISDLEGKDNDYTQSIQTKERRKETTS
jgi:hypothetical protein